MIYADTSALAKLFVNEDESAALHEWLMAHPSPVCTDAVGAVELRRLAGRLSRAHFDLAEMLLAARSTHCTSRQPRNCPSSRWY